jgi:serine phosphatase RsbU (regulator of sigma subunit)
MMSAAIKVIISQMPYRNRLYPDQFLTHIDKMISKEFTSHHATAAYLYFDFFQNQARLANAGHPPILYAPAAQPFREINSGGSLMGYEIRQPIADVVELSFQPGDRFFLYTDGLVEFKDAGNISLIVDDMPAILNSFLHVPSAEFVQAVMNQVKASPGFERFNDDVMAVLLEIQ